MIKRGSAIQVLPREFGKLPVSNALPCWINRAVCVNGDGNSSRSVRLQTLDIDAERVCREGYRNYGE